MAAAFTSPDSNIPQNLLQLSHSFGYDCKRRGNLQLLDNTTLTFIAGNMLVLLDMNTTQQRYIPSCGGGGIGAITPHPSREYFALAEKGKQPDIIIYEYPLLQRHRTLRGCTTKGYSCVNFNHEGTLLASVGGAPDYMLTLWDWNQEQVVLRAKAFSQDVYRVTFSPDNPCQLTTSGSGHIKFWKMADTFTCLKLQGMLGRFGKTPLTDIEGYVELPDGKVVSGSDWGNMLLWDEGLIKVEIRRKGGRTCHAGPIRQFILDEGELITVGADGAVRCWDFETIDTADCMDDSGLFEMQPMNELIIGRNVSLSSMVRSTIPDSTLWFAQDSNGGIWKLDLSFSSMTTEPECLFSFHAGAIEGLDVSGFTHLMATTALDRSIRIYDFLSNKELTVSHNRQGGSTLTWAPSSVCGGESLLVVGFEDGVVRLFELCNPQSLDSFVGRSLAALFLRQAFKPHNASVKAISYMHNGNIMATGALDGTVFFFSVEESYEPIGFVTVPGPVQCMQWAQSDKRNVLLVVCDAGHVVEVEAPDAHDPANGNTYHLPNLPIKHFCFRSIKSRIKRDKEIARRQAIKEKKKKKEVLQEEEEQETTPKQDLVEKEKESDEEEEELPPIFIPSPPSPLHCAFYSTEPGAFWLSVGGYDSGYLYHCKFSEQQSTDPTERRDEPFAYIPIQDADDNPIVTVCFCEAKQLLLCGMQDGSIRAYPLNSGELQPEQMQAYWSLGVHDDQYGSHRQLRVSYDNQFVLSTGADGNIFSFRLLDKEEMDKALQRGHAKVPSPPLSLDTESTPFDIDDPNAYSIETAKQKLELDRMIREAESRKQERRKKLVELRKRFEDLLQHNQSLPAHVRLQPSELELDRCFRDEIERQTAEKLEEVKRELAWETERYRIGLQKVQERFSDFVVCDTVTVSAIRSEHKVSTYRLLALPKTRTQPKEQELSDPTSQEQSDFIEQEDTQAEDIAAAGEALPATTALQRQVPQGAGGKLAARQAEKLRKAAEKAEKARARIEQRKREWDEFYASKPSEDYEDPEDIRAISLAREHMGDFKLKSAKDFVLPEHLRMNKEKKTAQVVELEEQIFRRKNQMNERVLALRDSKVALVSQFCFHIRRLLAVQKLLPPEKHRSPPPLPTLTPEETPERQLQCSRTTLKRYAAARAKISRTSCDDKDEELQDVLEMMQQDGDEDTLTQDEHTHTEEVHTRSRENLSELEQEILDVEEICNLYLQDKLINQMDEGVYAFDAKLLLLRHEKSKLDVEMKLTDLQHVTVLQELLLLKEFEKREIMLQERRNNYRHEERELRSKLKECKSQFESKKKDMAKLQEREKHLTSTFQASLGDNKFATFLTKVFKKKIKRVKKVEKTDTEDQIEESEDESDEESDWDSDEDEEELEGGFDDSVCPPNCDPELFNSALSLRERRLDLEELLSEEKTIADNLKKEYDSLTKKEKVLQSNLKATEGDLELLSQEKQQKVNELDVVVPLRLHQIEYKTIEVMPSDLSEALVMNATSVSQLHRRIKELHQEKSTQRQLYKQARQQHVQLRSDLRDMEADSQELTASCEQMMVKKFGKLVDLEALQTLGGSRKLEERKYQREVKDSQNRLELNMWQVKVAAAKQELNDVTKEHTTRLHSLNSLLNERKLLEDKLDARQKKTSNQFQETDLQDIRRLQLHVQNQAEKIEWLNREISILSHKGGHVLPPSEPCLPPIHGNTPRQHRRAFP